MNQPETERHLLSDVDARDELHRALVEGFDDNSRAPFATDLGEGEAAKPGVATSRRTAA